MTFGFKGRYTLADLELWRRHCAHQRRNKRPWQVRFREADEEGYLPRHNPQTPISEQLGGTPVPYRLRDYL